MPDQLAIWGFSANAPIDSLDLGTVFRRSSEDLRFRVKNQSGFYTARDVLVECLFSTEKYQFLISQDGQHFFGVLNIGDLAPGGITPGLYLRRNTPSTATLGQQSASLFAYTSTWSHQAA